MVRRLNKFEKRRDKRGRKGGGRSITPSAQQSMATGPWRTARLPGPARSYSLRSGRAGRQHPCHCKTTEPAASCTVQRRCAAVRPSAAAAAGAAHLAPAAARPKRPGAAGGSPLLTGLLRNPRAASTSRSGCDSHLVSLLGLRAITCVIFDTVVQLPILYIRTCAVSPGSSL